MKHWIPEFDQETGLTLFLLAALFSLSMTAAAEPAVESVAKPGMEASAPAMEKPVAPGMDASMYADGPAIGGYSPVSYFDSDGPRIGDPAFAAMHDGQIYHFTSDDERARFEAEPGRYVPVFGAFCAYNLALGRTTPIDPTNYKIVGDQLLLFHRSVGNDALAKWEADQAPEEERLRRARGQFRLLEF